MVSEREQWWPPRERWPEFPPEEWAELPDDERVRARLEGWRPGDSEALALLILEDVVVVLNGGKAGMTVQVMCNDLFYWACADSEPIPPTGFGADMDRPFWDLYDAYRLRGPAGVTEWCCLRRGMRPQAPIEREMREAGTWTAQLEALPARDPKECG